MTDELDNWYNDWNVEPMPSRQKEKLQALIAKECNKARIDELEDAIIHVYREAQTPLQYLERRLAELSNKENK